MKESKLLKKIHIDFVDENTRLFRNNVGTAFQGKHSFLEDGGLLLQYPRRIKFGLCIGSSDIIGFKSIKITEDMVGQNVAVFTALEIKGDSGKVTNDQSDFLNMVDTMGGLAGIVRTPEDAAWILKKLTTA